AGRRGPSLGQVAPYGFGWRINAGAQARGTPAGRRLSWLHAAAALDCAAKEPRMRYINLGSTGLKVSRICLGCMSYGDPSDPNRPWVLTEELSKPFFRTALEAGINFFDTANVYSDGVSEQITGRALKEFAKRDEIVVATKVHGQMRKNDPNGKGLSRKAILPD